MIETVSNIEIDFVTVTAMLSTANDDDGGDIGFAVAAAAAVTVVAFPDHSDMITNRIFARDVPSMPHQTFVSDMAPSRNLPQVIISPTLLAFLWRIKRKLLVSIMEIGSSGCMSDIIMANILLKTSRQEKQTSDTIGKGVSLQKSFHVQFQQNL